MMIMMMIINDDDDVDDDDSLHVCIYIYRPHTFKHYVTYMV